MIMTISPRPCLRCKEMFQPLGSNHLHCGSLSERTGCAWVNKMEKQKAFGKKYRRFRKLGARPDGRQVPETRKCLECKEPFVVPPCGHRKMRCDSCAPVHHNILVKKSSAIRRHKTHKCTPRPNGHHYQEKPCQYSACGKMFTPSNGKVKYCSDSCAYEAQKIQMGEHYAKKMQNNREAQRRKKDYERRTNTAKPPQVMLAQQLIDLSPEKMAREINRILGNV